MAVTPTISASEGRVFTVFASKAAGERLSSSRVFAIYNFPSARILASAARTIIALKRASTMDVSQARVFVVGKGRMANPQVRAWTFTLDSHDFYVLRLGDTDTLVYDTKADQWYDWDSFQSGAWRPNTGFTWVGGKAAAATYGSSVVAGDDTYGLLWFLDPLLPYDQTPDPTRGGAQQLPFDRYVTSQVLATGRQAIPCYAIFLDGDNYGIVATDFTPQITLESSDDQGRTFFDHGALTVTPDYAADNPYAWYSLGQITGPGRIFRVRDNGVYARVDSMEMNDAG